MEALDGRRGDVEEREDVAQAGRDLLAPLEASADHEHRDVGKQREGRREARHHLQVAPRLRRTGNRRALSSREAEPERARRVRDGERHVRPERGIECGEIVRAGRRDFLQHVRMAADGALPEDDHRAREDVRALDGDRDRNPLVAAAEVVVGTEHDPLAAVDVHGVVEDLAHALGHVVLADRRDDRGFLAQVERGHREAPRRIHEVAAPADARERLLDALEAPDRRPELRAHARVGAGRAAAHLRRGHRHRRQRDRAPSGEAFDEHPPAVAHLLLAADDP